MKLIIEIMNESSGLNSPIISEDFYKKNKQRLYPFTKSMLYQFDEYFNPAKDSSCSFNSDFNGDYSNDQPISFNLLTNALNYVAEGIVVPNDYPNDSLSQLIVLI